MAISTQFSNNKVTSILKRFDSHTGFLTTETPVRLLLDSKTAIVSYSTSPPEFVISVQVLTLSEKRMYELIKKAYVDFMSIEIYGSKNKHNIVACGRLINCQIL